MDGFGVIGQGFGSRTRKLQSSLTQSLPSLPGMGFQAKASLRCTCDLIVLVLSSGRSPKG